MGTGPINDEKERGRVEAEGRTEVEPVRKSNMACRNGDLKPLVSDYKRNRHSADIADYIYALKWQRKPVEAI